MMVIGRIGRIGRSSTVTMPALAPTDLGYTLGLFLIQLPDTSDMVRYEVLGCKVRGVLFSVKQ